MRKDLTLDDISTELVDAVQTYLLARTLAEILRERVDRIAQEILADDPLPNTAGHGGDEWITDPNSVYLCEDMEKLEAYWDKLNQELREAGVKPDDMPDEHCPALTAEHDRVKAEWAVIRTAGEMLGWEDPKKLNNGLLGLGLETRQEFIDLTVGLVVSAGRGELRERVR